MEIIDAHHHLWDRGRFSYRWLSQVPAIDRDYILKDYQEVISGTGVGQSIHVQAEVDPLYGIQETRWVLSMADAGGPIAGVVGWAPIEEPGLPEFLEKLGTHPRLKGIRRLIQSEKDVRFCARPEFVAGVRRLAPLNLSFDLCIYHPQLGAAIELVRQVPEVNFVLDHIGKPGIKDRLLEPWKTQLRELAYLPNVWCKVSGVATEAEWAAWTPADQRPYLDHVIDCFGFSRLMWGSDWPVCTLAVEYRRWLETVQEVVRGASQAEREQLFRGTAATFYRL
ncbi:MAG: amidohydrolase [Candidatus Handelsmanbacteria bacterium]|nr:amidohydrolase [Candidatus Handelsmanbacteria bacterium]